MFVYMWICLYIKAFILGLVTINFILIVNFWQINDLLTFGFSQRSEHKLSGLMSLKWNTSQFKVIDMCRKLELQCQRHHRHTSMFTMFGSSDDCVLLTMYPAELIIKNNFNR